MTYIIAQEQRGLTNGRECRTEKNPLDQGHSAIWAKGAETVVTTGGQSLNLAPNGDHIVIGYGAQGLPWQLVIKQDIASDVAENQMFAIQYIAPLLAKYQNLLLNSERSYPLMVQILDEIRALQMQHLPHDRFSISLAICYETQGKRKVTGFSLGETGVALRRKTGRLVALGCRNVVNTHYDQIESGPGLSASSRLGAKKPLSSEELLERNSYFQIDVEAGDEIVGYGELPESMQIQKCNFRQKGILISRYALREDAFDLSKPCLDQIWTLCSKNYQDTLNQSRRRLQNDAREKVVEHPMVGSMHIPSTDLQESIQKKILDVETKSLNEYSLYYMDSTVRTRVSKVLEMIKQAANEPNPDYVELITLVNQIHYTCRNPNEVNCKALQARGNTLQGHASPTWKAIGIALIALGMLILASGILIGLGTCGTGTLPATLIATGGTAIGLLGYGIFTAGCQYGLAKQVDHIAEDIAYVRETKLVPV